MYDQHHIRFGSLLKISPFFIIGILIVLVPIFIFIIFDNLKTHHQRTVQQLTDRGAALIGSFEAGTRTGVGVMRWGSQKLQWLLTETARQPGVEYILITDRQGKILAHSDPAFTDSTHPVPEISPTDTPDIVLHRHIQTAASHDTFEVYKKFTPNQPRSRRPEIRPISVLPPADYFEPLPRDWCRLHFFNDDRMKPIEQFIFAGLSMASVHADQRRYFRHVVLTGTILFLIGGTGIIALFFFLAYRSADTSFSRIKAFSDEVMANIPVGLITISPDRLITFCNPSGLGILGITADDTSDRSFTEIPAPLRNVAEQVMRNNQSLTTEVEMTDPGNRAMVLDVSGSPISEQNGRISGYLLLFKNLTHLKNLEKEVARSKRLAVIGKLAAGVAHEIRNPLSSIKGLATYFKEKLHDSPHDRETAEIMINEVERLNIAVAQLLEFAHPIAINTVDISPRELISHSLRLIENDLTARQIRFRPIIVTKKDVINTDPERVSQILLNLYLNAIQAMGHAGNLTVTVTDEETADKVRISVGDNGEGIAPEDLEYIFDPYFTNRTDSTGLGLAITHKLVESLGGEISVESVIGQGTVFHIRLPA